jgi:hypothetical protein
VAGGPRLLRELARHLEIGRAQVALGHGLQPVLGGRHVGGASGQAEGADYVLEGRLEKAPFIPLDRQIVGQLDESPDDPLLRERGVGKGKAGTGSGRRLHGRLWSLF